MPGTKDPSRHHPRLACPSAGQHQQGPLILGEGRQFFEGLESTGFYGDLSINGLEPNSETAHFTLLGSSEVSSLKSSLKQGVQLEQLFNTATKGVDLTQGGWVKKVRLLMTYSEDYPLFGILSAAKVTISDRLHGRLKNVYSHLTREAKVKLKPPKSEYHLTLAIQKRKSGELPSGVTTLSQLAAMTGEHTAFFQDLVGSEGKTRDAA